MASPPRITEPTLRVLMTMLTNPGEEYYGLEIARKTDLKTGTLYPILARLETAGWLTSGWEEVGPATVGRRLRRYYKLTWAGAAEATKVRQRLEQTLTGGQASLRDFRPAPGGAIS
jgi:DNA-binding PadR family transcriptional regulator